MKLFTFTLLLTISFFIVEYSFSQNVLLNVITQNSGIVKKGEKVFFEVTVTNTDPSNFIGIYKIKTQISAPSDIVTIDTIGHILPTGWKVIHNNGSSITLSNCKDMIAATDSRTLLIAVKGRNIGGPLTMSGQLSFSDGIEPGTAPGSLKGDLVGDNFSTSTIKVIK